MGFDQRLHGSRGHTAPHTTRAHTDTSTNPNSAPQSALADPSVAPLVAFMIGLLLARTTRRGQGKDKNPDHPFHIAYFSLFQTLFT